MSKAMKLDDKRGVIEVLLCCGSGGVPIFRAAWDVASDDDSERRFNNEAYSHFARLDFPDNYARVCLEAAYRLIESSPTLRREWFGSTANVAIGAIGRKDAIACRAIPLADQLEAAWRRVRDLEDLARRFVMEAKYPCPIGPCSRGCVQCDAERIVAASRVVDRNKRPQIGKAWLALQAAVGRLGALQDQALTGADLDSALSIAVSAIAEFGFTLAPDAIDP